MLPNANNLNQPVPPAAIERSATGGNTPSVSALSKGRKIAIHDMEPVGGSTSADGQLRSESRWRRMIPPLALLLIGGVLIDLSPVSGAAWLLVCLAAATLAGWLSLSREALWTTVVATVVVLIGTALVDGDGDSAVGGRVPLIETLLVVTLPMLVCTWIGIRLRHRSNRN